MYKLIIRRAVIVEIKLVTMATALSLIGIVSLLAGEVVEGALRYANVITYRNMVSFIVVPGLYKVSTRLLKRCKNYFALVLSPGERESRKKILGFEASGNYKYTGMQSGTDAPIINALFESWMNLANKNITPTKSAMVRTRPKMGSKSTLGRTNCIIRPDISLILGVKEPLYIIVSIFCQLSALAVLALMIVEMDYAGIAINIVNMVTVCVTKDKFSINIPEPTDNVPPGDMVVTNKSNNNIWVVKGNEVDIQSVAQKEIKAKGNCPDIIETIVYICGSLVAIATILVVPIMSERAQIYMAIQFGIGLLASIIFSSRDGEKMLKNLLDKHYIMEEPIIITFTNRVTAVAAAAFYTNANVRYIYKNLVPETESYDLYRNILRQIITDMRNQNSELCTFANDLREHPQRYDTSNTLNVDEKKSIELTVVTDFIAVVPDSINLLPNAELNVQNLNTWPGRLLMDIVEAFVQVYVVDIPVAQV
jgi:hypothetical protein